MDNIRNLLGADEVQTHDGLTLLWEEGRVTVEFRNERSHDVTYKLEGDLYTFRSTVATARVVEEVGHTRIAREILLRNRVAECVGFKLTRRDRLEALIQQRASTLHRDELIYYLCQLAREADRLEYLLTGRDAH